MPGTILVYTLGKSNKKKGGNKSNRYMFTLEVV